MEASDIFDVMVDAAKQVLGEGKKGYAEIEDFINELRPELEEETQIAITNGGEQTDLNTLVATANAVLSRTLAQYDTVSTAAKKTLRDTVIAVLIAGIKLAV
jgi:hypothetical protein